MEILALCNRIALQPEKKAQVAAICASFDFATVDPLREVFRDYGTIAAAHQQLKALVGADPDVMLACMLRFAAMAYEEYRRKGIPDKVYYDTMGCFPRFLRETEERTGNLTFDRDWWTGRQVGCHLFRIGALEYEYKQLPGGRTIGIHIPSDADFSPESVERSLLAAGDFFASFFPETEGCPWRCHSWLLDPQLQKLLPESANIPSFQRRFAICDPGEANGEFLEWVFHTTDANYHNLPETTSLQRNLKAHLLSGGEIRNAYGILRFPVATFLP